jgi:hypothetical protein
MKDVFEILGKAFHIDEFDLEKSLSKMGISFRGYVIYVKLWKNDKRRVTPEDVVNYYIHEAGNLSSGCRTLAGITGDWRPIDELAKQCLNIYKVIKKDELRKIARKNGLEPNGW